jgi:hypothetical protein
MKELKDILETLNVETADDAINMIYSMAVEPAAVMIVATPQSFQMTSLGTQDTGIVKALLLKALDEIQKIEAKAAEASGKH